MITFLIYISLAYLALAMQGLFFYGIKPDFALVLVCFFAVRHEKGMGMVFGAFTGLLVDVSSGFILGPNIFSKAIVGFLARVIRDNLFQWNNIISAIVVAVLSLVDIFVVFTCYESFSEVSFVNRSWGISAAGIAYTIATALIFYPLFHRKKDEGLWIRE